MLGQLGGPHAIQGLQNLPAGVQMQVQAVQHALGQQVQALQQQVQNLTQGMGNGGASLAGGAATPQTPQIVGMDATNAQGNQIPPPPPPPPVPFIQFAQGVLGGQIHQQPPAQANGPLPPLPHQQPVNPQQAPPPPHVHGQQHNHPLTLYSSFLRFERELGIESLCLSLHDTLSERNARSDAIKTEVKIVCIMRIPRREVERFMRQYPDELTVDREMNARTRFRKLHGVEVSLELSGYSMPGDGREAGGV